MPTRHELKEKTLQNEKRLSYFKRSLMVLLACVIIWIIVDSIAPPNSIIISNTNYKCEQKGCNYAFTVKNLKQTAVTGYARVTVFKTLNVVAINSNEVLSSERLEFQLNASEKRTIKGFYVTGIEADELTVSVGQVKK